MSDEKKDAMNEAIEQLCLDFQNIENRLNVLRFPIEDADDSDQITYSKKDAASLYLRGYLDGYCITKDYRISQEIREHILSKDSKYPFFDIKDGENRYKTVAALLDDMNDCCEEISENKKTVVNRVSFKKRQHIYTGFQYLAKVTPEIIEKQLSAYVLGQPELIKQVSLFLFYHALKNVHPDLAFPQRNILISGPSGCGKTEIWRVAKELYDIPIRIINSSEITTEGFKGDRKVSNTITSKDDRGTIFVFDEFDKLCMPIYDAKGSNVSNTIVGEILKYIEGDKLEHISEKGDLVDLFDTSKMGFAFVGAFQSILDKRRKEKEDTIGFFGENGQTNTDPYAPFSDEELIEYGMRNELVGRISIRCQIRPLTKDDYIRIAKNKNSRFMQLRESLSKINGQYVDFSDDVFEAYANEAIKTDTGVRGFLSKLENEMVEQALGTINLEEDLHVDVQETELS